MPPFLDQKLVNIVLSTALGPVFPLYGILERNGQLVCECRLHEKCDRPGKHPRWFGWNLKGLPNSATTHLGLIELWYRQFPNANWAILVGERSFALDCDVRPEAAPPKNGIAVLQELLGQPETIEVASGSGKGSRHYYYVLPENPDELHGLYGIDLKKKGFCVAPGSRHISGQLYVFVRSPVNCELAEAPSVLLDTLRRFQPTESHQQPARPQTVSRSETAELLESKGNMGPVQVAKRSC